MFNDAESLARLYGGSDKWAHGYMRYYQRHFRPLRLKRNRVLEIGVGGYERQRPGGSLRIWRDYFIRSTIIGIDIYPKTIRLGRRVHFMQANQGSTADLSAVVDALGLPNIVIDDGSHVGKDVVTSFEALFPLLPPGAWYVIEDLPTSYYQAYGGAVPASDITGVGLLRNLIDSIQALDTSSRCPPDWSRLASTIVEAVVSVHIYPGIAFIEKGRCT